MPRYSMALRCIEQHTIATAFLVFDFEWVDLANIEKMA